ncbi:Dienelactone hydrolase family protein [Candidatus Sulfotelmatomonas gaucii]|uniref:Dienelactone hydrolase family protein n=1 Tax=Candidatus Sulfuritelmatomonas gaucii TaxID=2043161 RepID=A0A2N9M5C9_9BACT|nr:Dienelactone hydrolase family protein [Candidatus Sulfotelmatomonas gaucii]
MSASIILHASDGHSLSAYVARPASQPIAGLVIIQEIFGVNAHIRSVADGFANDGFLGVAPALFDRIKPGIELGYEGADVQTAMSLIPKIDVEKAVIDVAAAIDYAAKATGKKVGVVGYCFGGSVAWLAATRLHPAAAVGYYGGQIGKYAAETPNCPVMLHFGRQDAHIPPTVAEAVHAAHPDVEIHWFDAGHAFNCDARASYNAAAAHLARERTVAFFKKQLA